MTEVRLTQLHSGIHELGWRDRICAWLMSAAWPGGGRGAGEGGAVRVQCLLPVMVRVTSIAGQDERAAGELD